MVEWQHNLQQKWPMVHFGEVKIETRDGKHIFEVQVHLADLNPNDVRVELYADGMNEETPIHQEMKSARESSGYAGGYVYTASVPSTRPSSDYTARVIPWYDGLSVPLEATRILWQR